MKAIEEEARIVFGRWNNQENLKRMRERKVWEIMQLYLYCNKTTTIISGISNITFPNLQLLHLSDNTITTIEALSTIDMPKLTSLLLDKNCITCINTMRKGQWPNLLSVDFEGNFILEGGKLTEAIFTTLSAKLSLSPDYGPQQFFDLRFLLKFSGVLDLSLFEGSINLQRYIRRILEQKCPNIEIEIVFK